MEHFEILALYDRHQRIEIIYPDMVKEVLPHLVRFSQTAPGAGLITHSRLDAVDVEAQIDAQLAYFQRNRLPFSWKVFEHDTPPDLLERLAARGFKVYAPEQVMVLDLAEVPTSLLCPPQELIQAGSGAELRTITCAEQLAQAAGVLQQVWGGSFTWLQERLSRHLSIPGYLYLAAVYIAGQAVSVGWAYFHPHNPFANLYGGATLPEQRGRGLYTALLAARVQEARRRGCRFATVDAGPMSAPIVRRHGFQLLVHAQECEWEGTAE
jgi:GNAT superfamily N-acetyltransferase